MSLIFNKDTNGSEDNIINKSNFVTENKRLWLQGLIVFFATLGTLSDGISTGWVSSAIGIMMSPNTTSSIKINSSEAALIGTLPMYGVIFSAPFSIYSANKIGRKWTIIWGTTLTCTSWICLTLARDIHAIYAGAFIRGVGGAVLFTVIPMYSAEISHAKIRGLLGSLVAVTMNIGVLISYITTLYFPLWITAVIGAVTSAAVVPLFGWAPRSPYQILVANGDRERAKKILHTFRGKRANVEAELQEMEQAAAIENAERQNRLPILELVTIPANRRVTIIVVTLQFIQQLSGIDAILIFLEFILDEKNSSVIFGVGKLASCVFSLLLIDRLGRKPLLIFSCMTSCASLIILGTYFYFRDILLYDVSSVKSWLPLTVLIIFVCCYNVGLGIVPFIYGGETYPTRVKALGVTVGEAMYALPMIITTEIFSITREHFGLYVPFFIFATCSFLGAIFCALFVIETKGKTLEEIQAELKRS